MAGSDHLGTQFHEMTPEEFGQQRGTWFHGTPTGIIGHHGGSFHVGSKGAATEALNARVHFGRGSDNSSFVARPEVVAGRITSPMTNRPEIHHSRGPGTNWNVREGIPRGEMAEWSRRSPTEAMSDVRANAVEAGLRTKGKPMRRGIYYVNASEGAQEQNPISAIIPNRAGFKTHEDHIIEAMGQGKKVPDHVMKHYPNLGQGKLF